MVLLRHIALNYFHIAERQGLQTRFPVGEEEEDVQGGIFL